MYKSAFTKSSKELVNLQSNLSAKNLAGWDEYNKLGLGQIKDRGYDGVKLDDDYIIFEPTQIKCITSKADSEMLKGDVFPGLILNISFVYFCSSTFYLIQIICMQIWKQAQRYLFFHSVYRGS